MAAWIVGPFCVALLIWLHSALGRSYVPSDLRQAVLIAQWAGAVVLLVPPFAMRILRCPEGIAMVLYWLAAGGIQSSILTGGPAWYSGVLLGALVVLFVLPPVTFAWRRRRPGRPDAWVTFCLSLAFAAGTITAALVLGVRVRSDEELMIPFWLALHGCCMLPVVVGAARLPILSSPVFLAVLGYWGLLLLWFLSRSNPAAQADPTVPRILIVLGLIVPLSLLPRWWSAAPDTAIPK